MTNVDPYVLPPQSWSARLAALKSRAVPDDDLRVVECHRALAFWRMKRAIDAARDVIGDEAAAATTDLVLELVM
ncbi:hypothetical protein GS433_17985 [Rhodococcus hoagii]|nr:hypothetical protein [Prescottella equi]